MFNNSYSFWLALNLLENYTIKNLLSQGSPCLTIEQAKVFSSLDVHYARWVPRRQNNLFLKLKLIMQVKVVVRWNQHCFSIWRFWMITNSSKPSVLTAYCHVFGSQLQGWTDTLKLGALPASTLFPSRMSRNRKRRQLWNLLILLALQWKAPRWN